MIRVTIALAVWLLAVPAVADDLSIENVALRDGGTWIRATSPSPFRIDLTLRNGGSRTLRLWDPGNSEGSLCPMVMLTSESGQRIAVRPVGIERSGIPTAVDVLGHTTLTITLDLARMRVTGVLDPGQYRGVAVYRNELAGAGPVTGVWTGTVESAPFTMQVVEGP